jgi:hypothetical protein
VEGCCATPDLFGLTASSKMLHISTHDSFLLASTCTNLLLFWLQVADYEVLLRRVMRRAPNAAVMSFGIFSYDTTSAAPKAVGSAPGAAQEVLSYDLPTPFYSSGERRAVQYYTCKHRKLHGMRQSYHEAAASWCPEVRSQAPEKHN